MCYKMIYRLLCVGILFFFLSSAKSQMPTSIYPLKTPQKTIINGTLLPNEEQADFWIWDYSNFRDENNRPLLSSKGENGKFRLELYLTHPIYLMPANYAGGALPPGSVFKNILSVRYASSGMLIEPGDSIYIVQKGGIDENNAVKDLKRTLTIKQGLFDSIPFFNEQKFSGRGAEKLWCMQDIIRFSRLYEYPASVNFQQLLDWSDSVAHMVLNTINIYKHTLSPSAISIIKGHYLPMLSFDISEMLTGEAGISKEGEINIYDSSVRKLYQSKVQQMNKWISPADPYLIYACLYPNILIKRAFLEFALDNNTDFPDNIFGNYKKEYYDILVKYLPDGKMKSRILGEMAGRALERFGLNDEVELIVNDFLSNTDSTALFHTSLKNYYLDFKKRLSKGGPIYSFSLPDPSGKIIKMEDFKNKVVLMDFMYNGCPGCAKMVPALSKVKDAFKHNKDVVFIAISIDKKREDWINGIGKYSVGSSIQLNVNQSFEDPIIKFYNIVAYPQIVITDRNGKLVTNNAPRPTDDNGNALIKLINQALNVN